MINALIVCDKDDDKLGDFFCLCKNHTIYLSQKLKPSLNIRETHDIDVDNMGRYVSDINLSNFLFFGFVHGSRECMYINSNIEFINATTNYYLLSNAFVYAFSCYNGSELADILINNSVHTYWGYSNKAWVCHDFMEDFKECALSGYSHFIEGCSVAEAEMKMIADMNNKIDKLYNVNILAATLLMENRDAMVVKGRKDLTISDFRIA